MSKYASRVDALLKRVSNLANTWLCILSSDERAKADTLPGIDLLIVIETYENIE